MRRAARPVAVAVAVALLVGCGGGGDSGSAAPEAAPAPDVDPIAFTRTAETVTGEQIDLGDYAGRDLVVWFWSPW